MQRIQPTSCLRDKGVQLVELILGASPFIECEVGYCDKSHEREGIEVTNYTDFLGQRVVEKKCSYDSVADLEASWLGDVTSDLHELVARINIKGLKIKILGNRVTDSMAGLARVRIINPRFTSFEIDETNPAGVLRRYEEQLLAGER